MLSLSDTIRRSISNSENAKDFMDSICENFKKRNRKN